MKNLCLLFHCIKKETSDYSQVNPSLYISLDEMDDLLGQLKNRGYEFTLPGKSKEHSSCSITFDDGYSNNILFLDLAKKYKIPFILFLSSYYSENQVPYIWDLMKFHKHNTWSFYKDDYYESLKSLSTNQKMDLMDDSHRPLTIDEIHALDAEDEFYLAPHTHTHQPFYGNFEERSDEEIHKNLKFLKQFKSLIETEFSFPCGISSSKKRKELKNKFERIYTVDGGTYNKDDRVINRISLTSPKYAGPLLDQIENQLKWIYKVKRWVTVARL
ncbi:polysaccharide deacetylase family protein [Halobacteriovorax sp. HLS]|uniref:polysaccharide deacetylase family protein n=1 Tax=Halobacteriovorax sp. HLS TaxID=2234000 RepID=UPI000FD80864|nr:polysaccharide deacetylase family protein [Halobacteriovorax sp. HLS]